MTELLSDDRTAWAARRLAAEFPSGELKLAGARTPIPDPIGILLQELLESVALGKSVSLIVHDRKVQPDETDLVDTLIAHGKIVSC